MPQQQHIDPGQAGGGKELAIFRLRTQDNREWSGLPSGWPSIALQRLIHAGLSIRPIAMIATIMR